MARTKADGKRRRDQAALEPAAPAGKKPSAKENRAAEQPPFRQVVSVPDDVDLDDTTHEVPFQEIASGKQLPWFKAACDEMKLAQQEYPSKAYGNDRFLSMVHRDHPQLAFGYLEPDDSVVAYRMTRYESAGVWLDSANSPCLVLNAEFDDGTAEVLLLYAVSRVAMLSAVVRECQWCCLDAGAGRHLVAQPAAAGGPAKRRRSAAADAEAIIALRFTEEDQTRDVNFARILRGEDKAFAWVTAARNNLRAEGLAYPDKGWGCDTELARIHREHPRIVFGWVDEDERGGETLVPYFIKSWHSGGLWRDDEDEPCLVIHAAYEDGTVAVQLLYTAQQVPDEASIKEECQWAVVAEPGNRGSGARKGGDGKRQRR